MKKTNTNIKLLNLEIRTLKDKLQTSVIERTALQSELKTEKTIAKSKIDAKERALTIEFENKEAELNATIEGLEGELRLERQSKIDLQESVDTRIKISTNTLKLKIKDLEADLETKENVSKRQHTLEIQKLKAALDIEKNKVELYKQQYEGTSRFTDQMLTTIQIMGTQSADATNAAKLIELTTDTHKRKE